jgi:hypothetical protein
MKKWVVAIFFLLTITGAKAQTAAAWNLNGVTSPTTLATGVTAGNVTLGSAISSGQFNSGQEYFGENGWPSGALDVNAYLQFSAGPGSGYFLNLNSLTITMRRSTTGSGSGPQNFTVRSSLDGYTADLTTGTLTTSYQPINVPLPAAFQMLTGSVSFRVYGYNQVTTSGGSDRFVFDNISANGMTTAGTLALQSLDLQAKTTSAGIELQWQAEGALAGTNFMIERSTDGTNFTVISNTADQKFTDLSAPKASQLYYRIQAQQPGEAAFYSNIATVTGSQATTTLIRSVATQGSTLQAALSFANAGDCRLTIWSRDGKPLYQQEISVAAGDKTIQLSPGSWPHGMYILSVATGGERSSKAFIL